MATLLATVVQGMSVASTGIILMGASPSYVEDEAMIRVFWSFQASDFQLISSTRSF
jgi:hypothetical protein